MTITTRLAHFFAPLSYEDLPKEVIAKTKEQVLDTLGVAIGAASEPNVQGSIEALKRYDSSTDCVIWGTDRRASAMTASLINGMMAMSLGLDDVHLSAKMHVGAVMLPVALALGEMHRISGKQLIAALAAGYETGIRIGKGIGASSHRLKGWHATSTVGVFGAALCAAKIIGLDAERTVHALGIAGSQSGGSWAFQQDGATSIKFHPGRAAEGGIKAALLALGGMTGARAVLEADDGGLYKMTSDEFNADTVVDQLGQRYDLMDVVRKPYPCCRSMHMSLDGILDLRREYRLRPEEIVKIDVSTYEIGVKQCGMVQQPGNVSEAGLSIPYGIAVALYDGEVGIPQFTEERIRDRRVLELAAKVQVSASETYTRAYPANWGSELNLHLQDGRILNRVVWNGKGSRDDPWTTDELAVRFRRFADDKYSSARVDDMLDSILHLEKMKDISPFVNQLMPGCTQ
ncbi:MmgE/PrpD family protein [Paenibacillus terrae HPL-003]|uniref:MmgE/PrpD family protein n=1 Tax=Paenibacillus terrae (strain HPL-003) TaxID=985665 RepID=G7VPS0_PAETH|nr:MmgE/PrpD family protein [Paenibacillus terrae]AET61068.1 MmgE/PrpD family protein [Paenibacillus terrae HPL-003]